MCADKHSVLTIVGDNDGSGQVLQFSCAGWIQICQTMSAQGYQLPDNYLQDFVKVSRARRCFAQAHQAWRRADICSTTAALRQMTLHRALQAENTFLHQTVWNPEQECLQPITPWPADQHPEQHDYVGRCGGVVVACLHVAAWTRIHMRTCTLELTWSGPPAACSIRPWPKG